MRDGSNGSETRRDEMKKIENVVRVFDVIVADSDPANGTDSGSFMFDGRIRLAQSGRFVRDADEGIEFQVMIVKKTGRVWRKMKPCVERDIITHRLATRIAVLNRAFPKPDTDEDDSSPTNKEIAAAAIANSQNVNELEIPDFLKRG